MSKEAMEKREQHVDDIMRRSRYVITECFEVATVVTMRMPSGYVLVEKSACVDPRDYDHDTGVRLCMEKLRQKVLELEAYSEIDRDYDRRVAAAPHHEHHKPSDTAPLPKVEVKEKK